MPHVTFDFSKGRAFVQEGVLYYSPNCSRPVVIPRNDSLPFGPGFDMSRFKQPAWWSPQFGWQSFIPLSPSFTSLPFENLCWMPKIVQQDVMGGRKNGTQAVDKQFLMSSKDVENWMRIENHLVRASELLGHKISEPASPPPLPSSFGFTDVF